MTAAIRPRRVECPRCGYDLCGVVDAWQDRCPLDAICSECGLGLSWRDLLNPSFRLPAWCIETPRLWVAWPTQVVTSVARACLPGRYWSQIPMSQPIRWRRVVALVVSLVLVLVVFAQLATASVAAARHRATLRSGRETSAQTAFEVFTRVGVTPLSPSAAATYSYVRLPVNLALPGTVVTRPGPLPRRYWEELWRPLLPGAVFVATTPLTIALAFAALPQSRRRAKVRTRHIVRVTMHGVIVPFVVLALAMTAATLAALERGGPSGASTLAFLAIVLLPVGTFVWWYGAIRRYLRMEQPVAVALSTVVIGFLLVPAAWSAWYVLASRP